jgi:hypothetical protein
MNSLRGVEDEPDTEENDNGLLLKAGVNLHVWNELLEKDHLYKGMLYYDEGNVCYLQTQNNSNYRRSILFQYFHFLFLFLFLFLLVFVLVFIFIFIF